MKPVAQALAVAVLVLSAVLAFRLGQTWGLSAAERLIYGSIVVLFEGLKALLPFAIVAAWRRSHHVGVVIAVTAFAGLVAMSFLGTLGFAELNRGALQGTRTQAVEQVATLRADIAALTQRLESEPAPRAVAEIDAEIASALQEGIAHGSGIGTLATLSADCTKLPSKRIAEACARVADLRRARATSTTREKLYASLTSKRVALAAAGGLDVIGVGDPQVAVVARLAGVSVDTARIAINIAFAALLEFVGGFGLILASLFPPSTRDAAIAKPVTVNAQPSAIATTPETALEIAYRYLGTCVRRDVSGSVTASAMHRDYARWCATERVTPMTLTAFGTFIARQGIAKAKIEGLVRYQQVALTSEVQP